MEENKSFHNFASIESPKDLKKAIFQRISEENRKRINRRKIFFRSGIFSSFIFLALSGFIFGQEIIVSDFWNVVSLIFTDMKTVSDFWQEFVLLLMETFPAEAVVFILMPIFILLALAKQYYQEQNLMELKFK